MPAVAGFLLIFAGWKMRHGEFYWLCVLGACLPIALLLEKLITLQENRFAVALGDWTALPFGTWALIVLTRRDVRAAFAGTTPDEPRRRAATGRTSTVLAITVGGLLTGLLAALVIYHWQSNKLNSAWPTDVGLGVLAYASFCLFLYWLFQRRDEQAARPAPARLGPPTPVSTRTHQRALLGATAIFAILAVVIWLFVYIGRRQEPVIGQTPAMKFDIAGEWESNWGPVTLEHAPIADKSTVAVGGYYLADGDKKAVITKGTYDAGKGRLEFSSSEPWIDVTATADLRLSSDGNKLEGTWSNSAGESGVWTMTRKSAVAKDRPINAAALTELQRLVALQENNVELVKNRFDAGAIDADEMAVAEIELLEAKIRLFDAEKKTAEIKDLGRKLIQQCEARLAYAKAQFEAGRVTEYALNRSEQQLAAVRIRFPAEPATNREPIWLQDPTYEEADGLMTETGALRALAGEYSIHFPRPYRNAPNLMMNIADAMTIDYQVKEQTPTGFKVKITAATFSPGATPFLKWKAVGQPAAPKQSPTAQQGTLSLDRIGEFQVNYPQTYQQPPHLRIKLIDVFADSMDYRIVEQTAAGFKINVTGVAHAPGRTASLEWRAVGVTAAAVARSEVPLWRQDPSCELTDGQMTQTGYFKFDHSEQYIHFPRPYKKPPKLEVAPFQGGRLGFEVQEETATGFKAKFFWGATGKGEEASWVMRWSAVGEPALPEHAPTAQSGSLLVDRLGDFRVNFEKVFAHPPYLQLFVGKGKVDFALTKQSATDFKILVKSLNGAAGQPIQLQWRVLGVLAEGSNQNPQTEVSERRILRFDPAKGVPIEKDLVAVDKTAWKIQAQISSHHTRLFELADEPVENCRVILRGQIKTEGIKDYTPIQARLQLQSFPPVLNQTTPKEAMFSSAASLMAEGTTTWSPYEVSAKLLGRPRLLAINLHTSFHGTVWLKDLELDIEPLPPEQRLAADKLMPAPLENLRSIRRWTPDKDGLISLDNVTTEKDDWKIHHPTFHQQTLRLFELRDHGLEAGTLILKVRMKTQVAPNYSLQAHPYLEVRSAAGGGEQTAQRSESWVKAYQNTNWTWYEAQFTSTKAPGVIAVNLRIDSTGTVWIDEVELLHAPATGAKQK